MPYRQTNYAYKRNLIIALAVSLLIHGAAGLWWMSGNTPLEQQAPVSKPYELSLQARLPGTPPPADSAESLAAAYASSEPAVEPPPVEMKPAPPKPPPAPERPQRKSERKAPVTPPENTVDAQRIIRSGLALAAAGLSDAEPGEISLAPSLNARTGSPVFAAYLSAWTRKVERIGQLNYPNQAIAEGQAHSLMMDVTLDADGRLLETQVLQSSGNSALDQAAIRIVELASPFPAFPPEMARQTPQLRITRRWRFADQGLGIRP